MPERMETESRKLLRRLRDTLAERGQGQEWLDRITHLISDCIGTEVCFNYLFRDPETPQLCATEGLVGRVARTA
jgi:phosphotransferase system enzyme I (PtsP)